MRVLRRKPAFRDDRGEITDILDGTTFDSLTILTCRRGSVRGNHYHKATTQFTYVLHGRVRLYTQNPGRRIETKLLKAGDLVISPPLERHAFRALADSELLAFCSGPRAGKEYESDTFKLDVPISGPSHSRKRGRKTS